MTLRTRFLLSTIAVGGGALAAVGAIVSAEVMTALERQFDGEMVDRLKRAAPVGFQAGSLPIGMCTATKQLQLVDEGGIITRCTGTRMPKPTEGALREALVKGESLRNAELAKTPVRMVLVPLTGMREEERRVLLHGAEPLAPLRESQSSARTMILLIFSGAFVFLIVAAYIARHGAFTKLERAAESARSLLRGDSVGRVEEDVGGDAIGSLVGSFNEAIARVDRTSDVQRRFMSDAARELARPLEDLRRDLRELTGPGASTEQRGTLDRLIEDAERLGKLVEGLSLVARLDAGVERVPADARADLGKVVQDVIASVGRRLEEQGTKLETELGSEAVVKGLPALLEMLVQSLLVNAAHHADTGGRVRIAVNGGRDEATLLVEDNGPAIAGPDRERVFARFARGTGGGLGLGLGLARDIARLQGGEIRVTDSPLGGPRFEVSLPRA